jgi:uncharacterized membrane protein (Fun14 family)
MKITKKTLVLGSCFAGHQLLSTIGIMTLAAFLAFSIAPALRLFTATPITAHQLSRALTETPGFPIQVGLGFVLGVTVGYLLKHRYAQWVWLLPLLIFLGAFLLAPVPAVEHGGVSARIAHFLGTACEPRHHCFDQIDFTLPLLASGSYAVGSFVGLRLRNRASAQLARSGA